MSSKFQLHLDPAPIESKENKEPEVDWFAEHGDSADTNTIELASTAQVTSTTIDTGLSSGIALPFDKTIYSTY